MTIGIIGASGNILPTIPSAGFLHAALPGFLEIMSLEKRWEEAMGLLSNIWKMLVLAIRAIAALPLDCLAWLRRILGLGGPPMPPRYVPETSVEDVLEGFRDAQVRKAGAGDAYVGGLGHTVFRYAAAADPEMRSAVDLTDLDDRQTDWLLGLRDEELRRLAQAGPGACELAARSRRCGIVGLPLPADEPSHRPQSGAVVPFPVLALAA